MSQMTATYPWPEMLWNSPALCLENTSLTISVSVETYGVVLMKELLEANLNDLHQV